MRRASLAAEVLRDPALPHQEPVAGKVVAVVYIDKEISPGMKRGIADAEAAERPVEYRLLEENRRPKRD